MVDSGVLGYRIVNQCIKGYYELTKTVITDPTEDTLLRKC